MGKENSFGETILQFFDELTIPSHLPQDVEALWPFGNPEVQRVMKAFYQKFYTDHNPRLFLVGINPGRFGSGVTGICFTDPPRLAEDCGISHTFTGGRELSSDFVYRVIEAYGGPQAFFGDCYLTALSPVGYVRGGKNLNYYDVKGMSQLLDAWMAQAMKQQISAGMAGTVAFSMGMGTNRKEMDAFNQRHGFFERIESLPHPRWVMQYRRKRLDEYISLYVDTIKDAVSSAK